jgi:hypothetical protein
MSEKIEFRRPIKIDGVDRKEFSYDTEEITVELFSEAMKQKEKNTGGQITGMLSETDMVAHLYLGFAAIIALNPEVDFAHINGIKGSDIKKVAKIGRNFLLGAEVSADDSSDGPSEDTEETSAPPDTK